MLLSPEIKSPRVEGVRTSDTDPVPWAVQNRHILNQRSVRGATALFLASLIETGNANQLAELISDAKDAFLFFAKEIKSNSENNTPHSREIDQVHTQAEQVLSDILHCSGMNEVKTQDLMREFSKRTGLVNGTLIEAMKTGAYALQQQSGKLLQSEGEFVRLVSSEVVPKSVLGFAKNAALTIAETDLLLHFLDRANELVSLQEIQAMTESLSPHFARAIVDLFRTKVEATSFKIEESLSPNGGEKAWILRIDPSLHQGIGSNAVEMRELKGLPTSSNALDALVFPDASLLLKQSTQNRAPSRRAKNTSVKRPTVKVEPKPKPKEIKPFSPTSNDSSARETGLENKAVDISTATNLRVRKQALAADTADFIARLASGICSDCQNEHVGEALAARFELEALKGAISVMGRGQKPRVRDCERRFRTQYAKYFSLEDPKQLYDMPEYRGFDAISLVAGSKEKIEALSKRVENGYPVFHPDDFDQSAFAESTEPSMDDLDSEASFDLQSLLTDI